MSLHFDSVKHFRAFKLGRRAYNRSRQRQAADRRRRLVELVATGEYKPTSNQKLADALGVARVTIWQDLQILEAEQGRCNHCGQLLPAVLEGVEP